jgi:hypothetical protein
MAEYLSSRSGQEKMRERSGRRVLLVPERSPQSEAMARLYGFDGVVEASGLDGPLEDFVAQLEGIVSAPSAVETREGITQGDLLVDVRGRTNTPANSRVAIAGDGEAFLQRFAERVGRFSAR